MLASVLEWVEDTAFSGKEKYERSHTTLWTEFNLIYWLTSTSCTLFPSLPGKRCSLFSCSLCRGEKSCKLLFLAEMLKTIVQIHRFSDWVVLFIILSHILIYKRLSWQNLGFYLSFGRFLPWKEQARIYDGINFKLVVNTFKYSKLE